METSSSLSLWERCYRRPLGQGGVTDSQMEGLRVNTHYRNGLANKSRLALLSEQQAVS